MPRFDYLDTMSGTEFHLPTSKDITDFFTKKAEQEEVPYTFIENTAECCCYIRCHLSDLSEEQCQYFHLSSNANKYRSKFRKVVTLQGFRIRCKPGFSLTTELPVSGEASARSNARDPTTSGTTAADSPRQKVYIRLKPVAYDNEFVIELQSISTARDKQVSQTSISRVFALQKASIKVACNNALVTPCCGVMAVLGSDTDIDVDGLVTLTTQINNESIDIPSHPSLVTEWSNDDLHPNTTLFVFLKKIKTLTHDSIQIWNLQYFAAGKCKQHEDCDCSLCKQYLEPNTTFNKGMLTPETPKRDVYFIRNGLSLSCKSENVIYLVTCKKCGMQYVGKSGSKMRRKFEEHVTLFKKQEHHEKLVERKLFYSHFIEHSPDNPLENVSVVIIDQLPKSSPMSINKLRQYWVNKLDTFNRGLNGDVLDSTVVMSQTQRSSFSLPNSSFTTARVHTIKTENHKEFIQQHDDNNNNQLIVKRFLEGLET